MPDARIITAEADVREIAFSRDGSSLAGLCADNQLRLWDVRSGSLRKSVAFGKDESPAAMPSGRGLLASSTNGAVVVRDLESGSDLNRVDGVERRLRRVAIAADGHTLAGSTRVAGNGREEFMRLWDATGRQRFAVAGGLGGTSALAISPDGSVLAAGSWDTNLRVWSTRDGELVRLIEDVPVSLFDMAFTPDGKYLAAAGVDRIVYFWNARTWKLERKLNGQQEMIASLAFSPDGRLLATGGFNDITQKHPVSILLWDVATGKILRTLPAPHRVGSVAFSPDGKLLASTSDDKDVRLWSVN